MEFVKEKTSSLDCKVDNSKIITSILQCLSVPLKSNQICHIEATPEALIFVVTGKGKATQGRVSFSADIFEQYHCDTELLQFAVSLNILLDCLQLFGVSSENTMMMMNYNTKDASFNISLSLSHISRSFYL
mmetsp:Transcript_39358/g.40093  ORF Transcript_39358/g.40093 Transcript_39358/m.40093 type:complete len:131 (+) Transcript_39358:134-526(+)